MFGLFQKKEKKPLYIHAKDVFAIIKSDYEDGCAFCLAEFLYHGRKYEMGSCLIPNSDECRENIYFMFNGARYDTFEDFAQNAAIDGSNLSDSAEIIQITRAGIIDGEEMIATPWGDTRLKKHAIDQP